MEAHYTSLYGIKACQEAYWKLPASAGRIVVVDPGDTTGYLSYWGGHEKRALSAQDFLRELPAINEGVSLVIVEDFVVRGGTFSKQQWAPQVLGAVRYQALCCDIPVILQQPSQAHRIDARWLDFADWKWDSPHELDCIRHLIYYLIVGRTK